MFGFSPLPEPKATVGQQKIYLSVPASHLEQVLNSSKPRGYELTASHSHTLNQKLHFNVVLTQHNKDYVAEGFSLSGNQLVRHIVTNKELGWYPEYIQSYLLQGKLRFNVYFRQNSNTTEFPDQVYHLAQSREDHRKNFNKLVEQGYVLLSQSFVFQNGKRLVTALYERKRVGDWSAMLDLNLEEFQKAHEERTAKGQYLKTLEAYELVGKTFFAATWNSVKPLKANFSTSMTEEEMIRQAQQNSKKGLSLSWIASYKEQKSSRFAALWEKADNP